MYPEIGILLKKPPEKVALWFNLEKRKSELNHEKNAVCCGCYSVVRLCKFIQTKFNIWWI